MINLIVKNDPKSPISEAYRTLRTNIQFSSIDKEIKTILITSAGPSEGKSTTSSNLAIAFAQSGKSVIIIDCDLRKPAVHKQFKISNEKGISNILLGDVSLDEALVKFDENLNVITAGTIPPNPAEMLASKRMEEFLNELKEKYEYIILDTPPVIAVTDAQILSRMVDGCILVASSGEAEIEAVKKAKELLTSVQANILGVVLNKAEVKSRRGYGYYYYYSQDGSTKERKKK